MPIHVYAARSSGNSHSDFLTLKLVDRGSLTLNMRNLCIFQQSPMNGMRFAKKSRFYWVGQNVHSEFSVRAYGKIKMNILANPTEFFLVLQRLKVTKLSLSSTPHSVKGRRFIKIPQHFPHSNGGKG